MENFSAESACQPTFFFLTGFVGRLELLRVKGLETEGGTCLRCSLLLSSRADPSP